MPVRTLVVKEASPEHLSWRARIARAEKPVRDMFLAWVQDLQSQLTDSEIVRSLITRSTASIDHVLQAVTFRPQLGPIVEREAIREFEQTLRMVDHRLHVSLNIRDPNFAKAVADHEARLVREVTAETRRAIANMIDRGYRNGSHIDLVASEIRQSVGLTSRQAQAVMNFADGLTARGVAPDKVGERAIRYARQVRARRAQTIARTETARAAVLGRLQSYDQAAAHGLFDTAIAQLEWSAVQDDPTEICGQLDGQRVPLGETFDGLLPPAHPNCRCSVHLVLDR